MTPSRAGEGPPCPTPPAEAVPAGSSRRSFWVRTGGSILLLSLLVWKIDIGAAGRLMARADLSLTIALVVLFAAANAYNGFRWWLILRIGGQLVPLWPTIRVTLWSALVGTFLPGLVGVEMIRFSVMSRHTGNPAMVFCSVMVDRFFGIVALLVLVLGGCVFSSVPIPPVARDLSVAAVGLAVAGMVFVSTRAGEGVMRAVLPRRLEKWVLPKLEKVLNGIRRYRQAGWPLVISAGLALVAQLIRVFAVILADRALGIGLDPALYFVIIPVSIFLEMLPVSILGLGIREVSMVGFFGLLGESTENGLALSLFVFLTFTLSKLPGLVALFMETDDVRKTLRQRPAAAEASA